MRITPLTCAVILAILVLCVTCSGTIPDPAVSGGNNSSPTVPVSLTTSSASTADDAPSDPQTWQEAIITGQVFSGPPGSYEQPLQGVSLELFCSAVAASPGVTDGVVKTNSSGHYSFDVTDGCNFYTIVLYSEGEIIHAESDSGVVIEGNRIRLTSPPAGAVSGGNNFWVASPAAGSTATAPGSSGLDILAGGLIVIVAGIITLFAVLLLRRRKGGDECG